MAPCLDAALRYAELGYAVLPCAPDAKKPLTEHGLKDATTDEATICVWWERWPTANVAIRTDGLMVLDFDPIGDKADPRANPWLIDDPEKFLDLAVAPMATTPRKGRHYYFADRDQQFRNSAKKLAPNVDIRATGGYVLAAPSVVDGKPYEWQVGSLDCKPEALPNPPAWLAELLAHLKDGKSIQATAGPISANRIPDGQRNDTLYRQGCAMRRCGFSREEIAAALHKANLDRCDPPMPHTEVDTIASQAAKYEPDQTTVATIEGHWAQDFAEPEADPSSDDPGAIPPRLLYVPGFIGEVMAYSLDTAPYPNAVLAFGGALVLQAFLASRKVREIGGSRPSLYILGLANSGVGKEHPRQVTQRILDAAGLSDCVASKLASYEGLEDALFQKPAMLLQIDEVDALLQAVRSGKETRYDLVVKALTEIFTAAGATYHLRTKANQETPRKINQPGLNVYGTAIPSRVYESMTPTMLIDGFFSRLLIIEAGKRGEGQEAIEKPLPDSILRVAQWWAKFVPNLKSGDLANFNAQETPDPLVIGHTPDAAELLTTFRKTADGYHREAEARDDQVGMAIWSRANEKCRRLAVNWACSENYLDPLISAEAARWAIEFITHQTRRMLFMASVHVTENDFEARCQKLLRLLRQWRAEKGDSYMSDTRIKRKLRGWTPREHEDVRRVLTDQGRVEQSTVHHDGAGRPATGYRLRQAA